MRLSTYICAAIAPVTALVIVLSGCSYAQDFRGTTVTSRGDIEKGSQEVRNERQTLKNRTSQMEIPYERNSTGNDLRSRELLPIWKGGGSRVIGDRTVKIEDFPFVASLEKKRRHLCSLFIINEWWLLTAGHCTIDYQFDNINVIEFSKPRKFSVVAGSSVLTVNITKKCLKDEVRRKVDRLVWHPDYMPPIMVKDLVLVHVSRRLPFGNRIRPATLLKPQQHITTGRQCQVIGWGPSPNGTRHAAMSSIKETCRKVITVELLLMLQKKTVTLLTSSACIKEYPYVKGSLREEHICTNEGQDPNSGDSGSPLICDGSLVALISGGFIRGEIAEPIAFTLIGPHLDWIATTTTTGLGKANLPLPPTTVVVFAALGQLATTIASICHV